jgi:hypothetical protein
METVLNIRYDTQKRPKIVAGNDCRKGSYSTVIMVQHDKRVKRSYERGTSGKKEWRGDRPALQHG